MTSDTLAGGLGRGASELLDAYFAAVRDVWGAGLSALEAVGASGASQPMAPLAGLAAAMAGGLKAPTDPAAAADALQGAASQVADLSPAIAQACTIAVASTLRYWQSLASITASHQAGLLQAAAGRAAGQPMPPPSECRVMADDVRAFFREVGEAAMLEARRLQMELEAVAETAARATEGSGPAGPHQRRWKAKE